MMSIDLSKLPVPPWTGPTLGPRTTTALLFAGVFLVLILATLFGRYLRRRVRGRRVGVIESYVARVRGWWIMVAWIGVAFLAGRKGVALLFAFASFGTLREFITLSPTRLGDHWTLLAAFFLVLPLHYLGVWHGWLTFTELWVPVFAFLFLPIISALRGDAKRFMDRAANVQWGLMICVYCLSNVPQLLGLRINGYAGRNLLLIAFLVLVVQSGDVLQKFFSARLGRTRAAMCCRSSSRPDSGARLQRPACRSPGRGKVWCWVVSALRCWVRCWPGSRLSGCGRRLASRWPRPGWASSAAW